jgi:hypothetical protein
MKKCSIFLICGVFGLLVSGCGMHQIASGLNTNVTNVTLSGNNYKIIKQVKGSASTLRIFSIGGIREKDLVAMARENMMQNVDMVGFSRAIINETMEIHNSLFPVVRICTITMSGYVIEFTDAPQTGSPQGQNAPAEQTLPVRQR